jgi:general secretion pathway protein D
MGLGGCSETLLKTGGTSPSSSRELIDSVMTDTASGKRAPAAGAATSRRASSGTAQAEVYYASGEGAKADDAKGTPEGATRAAGDGVNLNFENAEIKTVARAILGDVLHYNYAVDPRVSGTITLSTRRPVAQKHVLSLLETALRAQGAVIVQNAGVHRILPEKEAGGVTATHVGRKAGAESYALTVLPLENVSAESLLKILDGFATRPRAARVDPERNLLIVQGTAAERQALIDTAVAFDVDWMRGQSVGIFPLKNANPETVIRELGRMVDGTVVQFQPIERMNAVLAISKSTDSIKRVSTWIGRLDRTNDAGARVRVYRLKYADARRIAGVIREMFGSGSGQTFSGTATSQTAPGGGTVTARVAATPATSARDTPRPDATRPPGPESTDDSMSGDAGLGAGKIRVSVDPENNAVVVYSSQEHAKVIEDAIRDLDRAPMQVAIEATIAEITLNDTLRNGVQFFLSSRNLGLRKDTGSIGSLTADGSEASPKFVLDALREVSTVKILSSPSLVVVNNQPAILQVGDQVPVTTRQAQDLTNNPNAPILNSVDFRDTGVILRVTPRVNADSMIGIDIEQEISAVKDTSSSKSDSALTPTISQRRVKSKVSVADGQTLLIGGLISEQRTKGKSGIPGVVDLPIVGEIFGGTHNDEGVQTELIIFLKPRLMRDTNDARNVAESLRRRMKGFDQW